MMKAHVILASALMGVSLFGYAEQTETYKCYIQLADGSYTIRDFEVVVADSRTPVIEQARKQIVFASNGVKKEKVRAFEECVPLESVFVNPRAQNLERELPR